MPDPCPFCHSTTGTYRTKGADVDRCLACFNPLPSSSPKAKAKSKAKGQKVKAPK
jgi:hypothetical protein